MAQCSLNHMEKKESTAKWFVFWFLPVLDLLWGWKAAEVISGHGKKHLRGIKSIDHVEPKYSPGMWFALILGVLFYPFIVWPFWYDFELALWIFEPEFLLFSLWVLIPVAAVGVYLIWRLAEVVSGHEKIVTWKEVGKGKEYVKYEYLKHKEEKDSTAKWFVFAIIPFLNLYYLWKVAEVLSSHEFR